MRARQERRMPEPRSVPCTTGARLPPGNVRRTRAGIDTVVVGEAVTVCSSPEVAADVLRFYRKMGMCK
jgi:hypothetical protein